MIVIHQTYRLEPIEPAEENLPLVLAGLKLLGSVICVAAFIVLIYFLCVGGCLVFHSAEACHV